MRAEVTEKLLKEMLASSVQYQVAKKFVQKLDAENDSCGARQGSKVGSSSAG